MPLRHKKLTSITESDLLSLIENKVSESKTLEFKSKLSISSDSDKKEFLADVTALANTDGGDIIFGIRDEKDIAVELCGLDDFIQGKTLLTIEQCMLTGITPRLNDVEMHPILLSSGKYALIIRLGKSLLTPHMATYSGSKKFYFRAGTSKFEPDVFQLRDAFVSQSGIVEKIKEFRLNRIQKILNDDIGVILSSPRLLVIHILPVASLNPATRFSCKELSDKFCPFTTMTSDTPGCGRATFEGVLVKDSYEESKSIGYTLFFREGFIESVSSVHLSCDASGKCVDRGWEKNVFKHIQSCLTPLRELSINPPYAFGISMLNVKGHFFPGNAVLSSDRPRIQKDHLILSEVLWDENECSLEKCLKSVFDQAWNAGGYMKSPAMDENGDWVQR